MRKVQTFEHVHNLVSSSFKERSRLSPIDFSKVRNMARTRTPNHRNGKDGHLHPNLLSSALSNKRKGRSHI